MNIRHAHVDLDSRDVISTEEGSHHLAQDSARRVLAELGASISKATVNLRTEDDTVREGSFFWSGGEEILIIFKETP